ncbi:MAG: trypsin-like peptidase domain-containing protein [Planctomycetes bacterium]|nr:trypsin-like peptidase domain-containing protein [Planctomycetota bacterium]
MRNGLKEITESIGSIFTLLTIAVCSLCYAQIPPAETPSASYEKSVVMIMAVNQEYDYSTPWKKAAMGRGVGSGFVIEGNRILTNAHNVANQRYIEVKKQNLAQRYPAQVEFVGHDCDLAVLRVADPAFFENTEPVRFGGLPKINSTVQTCGFPMGGRQVSVTEGVVSRLETSTYSHSQAARHLVVQTDAAINPGNSGGPVFQGGLVVGVAFQGLQSGDNIGYMIPTTVIDHFLKDIGDGRYDGFGKIGVSLFPGVHNPFYKQYLKIPREEDGVVLTDISLNSMAQNVLMKGDVITQIDDFNIDNDGRILIDGLSLELSEAVDRKQIGEEISIIFYREGKKQSGKIVIAKNAPVIPWDRQYDQKPDYRVFAGLTFVPVTRNYLESWGRSWITDVPFTLRYLFVDSDQLNNDPNRVEYVSLSEVLPDEVNAYSEGFKGQVIESVNGFKIKKLADLDEAFKTSHDGYWVVHFIGNSSPLVMDAEQAVEHSPLINNKYQVPAN